MGRMTAGLLLVLGLLGCDDGGAPVGEVDAPAMEACGAQGGAVTATLALSPDAAGAADVVVEANAPVMLTGEGFFTRRVPHPHHDFALFVTRGATLLTGDLGLPSALRAGPCARDLSDYRVHVHDAGDFVFELQNGGGETWLMVIDSPTEHFHPDGGMHDHDGGHHDHDGGHHDHDAGHHEHDGGHHDHDGGHAG